AYVSFGELIAWIIGWALILEYAIGNIVVAISWSGYFHNLLQGFGLKLPLWLTVDPATAMEGYHALELVGTGAVSPALQKYAETPLSSVPTLFGHPVFVNLPAFIIVGLISILTYI